MSNDPSDLPSTARPEAPEGIERELGLRKVLVGLFGGDRPRRRVGRFELHGRLGGGGMGEVFRAEDPTTKTMVALKLLTLFTPAALLRFEREALALRNIEHPGIVGYIDHGQTEQGRPWLAMHWIDGVDLATALQDGPLTLARVLQLGLQLTDSLSAAHRASVVHRDVKPSNIMLPVGDALALLIDFGVAKDTLPEASRLTSTGIAVGSPSYMAPEQLRGHSDERTDVYGLGATLFEACTGRPPFMGDTQGEVILSVLSEPPPHARSLRPEVPRALEALLARMLAKNPSRRPQDMPSVAAELAVLSIDAESSPLGLSHHEQSGSTPSARTPPQHTPMVGRAREIGLLQGALQDVLELQLAGLVQVIGPSGSGRSRLLEHLSTTGFGDVRRIVARPDHRQVPFSTLRQLLDATQTHPKVDVAATSELSALLERDDSTHPRAHADQVLLAWLSVVEALGDADPILWVVDDVQHADLASLRLLDRALHRLMNRALALVFAAPEDQELVGERLPQTRKTSVELRALPTSVMRTLCTQWGVDPIIVDSGYGRPGLLLPTARADVSAIDGLGDETRRTLRAAAIVGPVSCRNLICDDGYRPGPAKGPDDRFSPPISEDLRTFWGASSRRR